MSQINFKNREEADAAVADVRADSTPTNWALFGYAEGSKNDIVLESKGSGGHTELKSNFKADKIQYGLLRVNDTVDSHVTVKFVFILWVGDKVKAIQRALTATHKGDITAFIGAHHVSLYGSNANEISEDVIMSRITDASGTSNRVLTADLKPAAAPAAGSGATKREVGGAGTGEFAFADKDAITNAIAALRTAGASGHWVLLSYQGNTNTVGLVGTGTGGMSELVGKLNADGISYGLVRIHDRVDETDAVKFVMIVWVGENIPAVRKAKITTHRGTITEVIGQRHVEVYASNPSELTDELVTSKVKAASGTAVHVKEVTAPSGHVDAQRAKPAPAQKTSSAAAAVKAAPAATSSGAGFRGAGTASSSNASAGKGPASHAVPKAGGGNVTFHEESAIRDAIAAIRKDNNPNDWLVIGYQGTTNVIEMKGTGGGGLDALKSKLSSDGIFYGLLRTSEKIDDSVVTKFVFIIFIGEGVKGVRKAAIATHKGAVTEFIGQYHVDVTVATPAELTADLVRTTVQKAAGTLHSVK